MSDPFIGEIRIFPFGFAPKGWAFCDGQLIPISQNTALFSIVGTIYGGNGKSTFALPDLMGRASMDAGLGPGLSLRDLGEVGGTETVTLLETQIPAHSHNVGAQDNPLGSVADPTNATFSRPASGNLYFSAAPALVAMSPSAIAPAGGAQPHNNMQPYLTLNFCIATQGEFPKRG